MMSRNSRVRLLTETDLPTAAAISEQAFLTEAFASRMFRLSSQRSRRAFRAVIELRFLSFWAAGHPVQGLFVDDQLAGVALYKGPQGKLPAFFGLRALVSRAPQIAPLVFYIRYRSMVSLLRLSESSTEIPEPHLLLEMIAVDPSCQGQGMGKTLLQAGQTLAQSLGLEGVYLYTGDTPNVRFYQKLGFHIVEARESEDLTVYHMFWAASAGSDS